jgi:hypothetical protein
MSKTLASEVKLLRLALVHLVGSAGLPEEEQLSPAVLDKAAQDFKKLKSMNGQWFDSHDLKEYFKIEDYRHNVGYFIIEHFKFSNYYVYRRSYYYNKADVVFASKGIEVEKCKSVSVHGLKGGGRAIC